eukprot:357392-Chlamydomonas_euryale.AAC.10
MALSGGAVGGRRLSAADVDDSDADDDGWSWVGSPLSMVRVRHWGVKNRRKRELRRSQARRQGAGAAAAELVGPRSTMPRFWFDAALADTST